MCLCVCVCLSVCAESKGPLYRSFVGLKLDNRLINAKQSSVSTKNKQINQC